MKKSEKYLNKKHKELVDACSKNDRNAQIRIYDLYYKAMYNTCIRIVKDSFIAEDIMQESFLDAFSKISTFEWRSSFGAWLKRIVINKSLDNIKSNNSNEILEEKIIDVPDDEFDNDHDQDYYKIKLDEIKTAIDKLNENARVLIVLHLIEGYDHHEISQILEIPYNNVRVRYLRAKRKLIEKIMDTNKQHILN